MNDVNMKQMQTKRSRKHPKENANILSRLFFCWTIPIFVKGYKKDLEEADLFGTLKEHESRILGDRLENAWHKELEGSRQPSLNRALFRVFGFEIIWQGFALVIIEGFKFSQPVCLGMLITYYIPNQTTMSKQEAYIFASLIVLISFIISLLIHWYMLSLQHLGMKMRVACSSLVYRKSLKLSKTALGETTIGQLVNLLSNDVSRFDYGMLHFHSLWVGPLETAVIMGYLWYEVGITGITGVVFLIMFIPFEMYLGKKTSKYRLKTALRTDERVRLMSEIISGIQVIKMYTWEKPFAKLVAIARKLEIKQIRATSYIRAILLSLVVFSTRFGIFLTVLAYVLIGQTPDAKFVFMVTAFYNMVRQAMVQSFPRAIIQTAEALISVRRLHKFLLFDEVRTKTEPTKSLVLYQNSRNSFSEDLAICINLEHVSAKWSKSERTLSNINLLVKQGELTAVIGEVGSGKSSLLHVILKELPLMGGSIVVKGSLSYAPQEPWLFSGTIKENILFGQPFDVKRYREVIKACSLERDFSLFTFGDNTIIGERGVTLSGGQKARISLARALFREADIYLLDDPLSAVDAQVGKQLFQEAISGFLHGKCTVLVTHQLQFLQNVDKIVLLENGSVAAVGTYRELQASGEDFAKMLNEQTDKKKKIADAPKEEKKNINQNNTVERGSPAENKESKGSGNISGKVYKSYMKAGGKYCVSVLIMSTFLMTQMSASGADYFVSYWVNLEEKKIKHGNETSNTDPFWSTENCIYIYTAIVTTVLILTLTRSISFFKFCMRASTNLHNDMFNKIVFGKMSFFHANSSGRVLNRFSKDMGTIDEQLPSVIVDTLQVGLSVLGICVVIAIVNFWVLIPNLIIFGLFYLLRVFYLATSRNVKRLEGTTKSPVFTHLNSSIQGLTTIRAFGSEEVLKMEFDNHQDLHSSAFYMFLGCTRGFGFSIDLLCVIYIGIVTMSFLLMGTETHGGNVGLAITQAVGLTGMLQWGMRQWSELENQMTAVERVTEYTEIETEVDRANIQPPKFWPENGIIEFRDVSLRYNFENPYVLKKLNFKVNSKEKIGIVGRTGAGKSSIITALFQISETEGNIIIDGLNIKEVPLKTLRSKISIIPQDPVLFSGTLRKNLDPFDEYKDDELWNALEEVELKNQFSDLPSGLNSKISEGGSNLSVGQRQLLCLARAILRKNKILVLDEATANVDPKTDSFIQKTIRKKFVDCTVLTIAHRLHTIIDSDKILVMDGGNVAAFDHPYTLMNDKEGILYKLVQQTGEAMTSSLLKIAEKTYNTQDTQ